MGLNDNIKKNTQAQKEFNSAAQSGVAVAAALTEEARNLNQELKDQLGVRSKLNEYDRALLSLSKQITTSAQENKEALGDAGNIQKQIAKEIAQLNAAEREAKIASKGLSDDEIAAANKIAQLNAARIQAQKNIEGSLANIENLSGEEAITARKKLTNQENYLAGLDEGLKRQIDGASKDVQRLAITKGLFDAAQKNLEVSEREAAIQDQIAQKLGIAGNVVGALKSNFGGFAKAIGIDQVAKDMEKAANDAVRGGKALSRWGVLGVGIKSAFKGLMSTLTDPTVILASLLKGFKEVDKAAVDFQRTTGEDGNTFALQIDAANSGFITMVDYLKTATALTKELGMNATNIFSAEDLQEAARIEHYMGMTAKEASQLAQFSKINGRSLEANNEALVAGVNSFNAQNKTGVLAKGVLEDVANVSKDIGILYLGYPEKLGAAATAAAAMGTNLEGVKKLASSLLEFESSIQAEMEAEVLTGKQLNLEKARQFALSNDLEGVSRELMNQGITSASFSRLNSIQQQAQAKALGMSTEQMATMLIRQGLSLDMSERGLSDAQKQTLEHMKQEEAGKKMEAAMAKISQALAPLVDIFADILTPIAGVLSNSLVLYSTLTLIAATKLGGVAKNFKAIKDSVGGALKNLKGLGKGMKDLVTGGGAGKLKDSLGFGKDVKKKVDKIPDAPKSPEAGIGKKIKEFLTGLASGLKNMGKPGVIKGALATLLAAPGIIALGLASPALAVLAMIPGKALQASLTGLGKGLSALGTALMGPQLLGIALGLGILTVSMIGIGAALGLAAPGIEAFGTVINSIFTGVATVVTAVADGFVKLMEAVSMENILPLLLLGPALFGIAGGLASMALAGLGALPIIGALGALALVASPLATLAGVFGGGGGGGDGDGEDPIVKKLDELIEIVSKGGDVIMDGNKVGRTLTLASSQIG